MAWKDEFDNAKKVFQNGTPKEKLEYFWDYYKWHLIVFLVIAAVAGNIIYHNVTEKEYLLQGIFLNAEGGIDSGALLEKEYLDAFPIDTSKETIFFDTGQFFSADPSSSASVFSYNSQQVMSVKIAVGEIDFMTGDLASMNDMAYKQYFYELTDLFTEEQFQKYESCFLYYDKAFAQELNDTGLTYETVDTIVYPDPRKPELMTDPVPIMIDITDCRKLDTIYPDKDKGYAMSFIANGAHIEKALEYLDYLFTE